MHQRQTTSRDDDLKELLDNITGRLPILNLGVHTCIVYTPVVLEGMKKVMTKLGEILKKRLAILLPELYNFFTKSIDHLDIMPPKILFGCITSFLVNI